MLGNRLSSSSGAALSRVPLAPIVKRLPAPVSAPASPDLIYKTACPAVPPDVAQMTVSGEQVLVYDTVVATIDARSPQNLVAEGPCRVRAHDGGMMKLMGIDFPRPVRSA